MSIRLAKAMPTVGPIEDVTIAISGEVPVFSSGAMMIEESAQFYQEQAVLLVDALQSALPGGTLDRVLCELLKRKASHFRVAYV